MKSLNGIKGKYNEKKKNSVLSKYFKVKISTNEPSHDGFPKEWSLAKYLPPFQEE